MSIRTAGDAPGGSAALERAAEPRGPTGLEALPIAEAALARLLVDTAQEGVWVVDEEGHTTYASHRLAAILGCSVEELLGCPMSTLVEEPKHLRRLRSIPETDGPDPLALELTLSRFDGERTSALVSSRPLRDGENRCLGHVLLVTDLSNLKSFEKELELVTMYDALTGLPNRTLFEDRLSHALKRRTRFCLPVACLLLDVEGLDNISDTRGSSAADDLLKLVGARLVERVRPEDTVARVRHDQLGILLDGVPGIEAAVTIAGRIATAFDDPFEVAGHALRLTASLGIALHRDEGQDAEELIRFASVAMRRAREKGEIGTAYAVFDAWQDTDAVQRRRLNEELRSAIDEGDLRLHYQPFVDLASREIVGAEALVRWAHPTRGFIYPAEFIDLANATGLIVDLGRWVFEEAFARLAAWRSQGLVADDFVLAINVDERQLREPGFAGEVQRLLGAAELPPRSIQLEIRESAAIKLRSLLGQLRRSGVVIAVDDMGKGQASLEHLARLDVDAMKIDRTFIAGLGAEGRDRAVVESIILFTDLLGIRVIAEGVEDEAQRKLLTELGCRTGQGYHFARPMAPEQFEEALAGWAATPAVP